MLFNNILTKRESKMAALSLRQNFSWTFMGNVIYAGCQWGMLVVLAKLGSPEMVGMYALGLAITAPVILLTDLKLRTVQVTDAKGQYNFGEYLGLRVITSLIGILLIGMLVIILDYKWEFTFVIFGIGFAKVFESISDIIYGLVQKNECMNHIAFSRIIRGLLSLCAMCLAVCITKSIFVGTLALALTWFCVLVLYDVRMARCFADIRPKFDYSTLLKLVKISWPLGIVQMLASLNVNIPRFFIERFINAEALGYFAALAYLIVAGNTVVSALAQAASPRLAKYCHDKNKYAFNTLVIKLVVIGIMLGSAGLILSLMFGQEVLSIIYQDDYAKYADVFVMLMLAALFTYIGSFIDNAISAARRFKIQMYLAIVIVSISVIASMILIPFYGLQGAAYVVIITSFLHMVTKVIVLFLLVERSF